MTKTPSMTADVRRALEELWPRVHEAAQAQLTVIKAFDLAGEDATVAERDAAWSAAHRLRGSVGMFGRQDASAVAEAIEDLLAVDVPLDKLTELRSLVERLEGLVGRPSPLNA